MERPRSQSQRIVRSLGVLAEEFLLNKRVSGGTDGQPRHT